MLEKVWIPQLVLSCSRPYFSTMPYSFLLNKSQQGLSESNSVILLSRNSVAEVNKDSGNGGFNGNFPIFSVAENLFKNSLSLI